MCWLLLRRSIDLNGVVLGKLLDRLAMRCLHLWNNVYNLMIRLILSGWGHHTCLNISQMNGIDPCLLPVMYRLELELMLHRLLELYRLLLLLNRLLLMM